MKIRLTKNTNQISSAFCGYGGFVLCLFISHLLYIFFIFFKFSMSFLYLRGLLPHLDRRVKFVSIVHFAVLQASQGL